MKKLKTVDADTLLYQPLDKPSFVVDGLIPTGLTLFCGAQKIGKSWLMLKLCLCVSEGRPLWELPTTPGDVLYLCLEDTFYRIQDRLFRLTDEASDRLRFAVASCKLTDGLVGQLEDYLKERPGTRLIVIDTLQKIRTASKDNAYANDYGDISLLKDFADRHALAVVVVHHIRKQGDSDIFNRVSGTTGLTGSADATFVLEKEHRASDTAALYAIGRDIEYQEWSGTATELLTQMGETGTAPNVITKLLNEYHATVLRQNNVRYVYRRTKAGRRIVLSRGDGVDSGDGLSGMPSVRGTAVTPVL